MGGLWVWLVVGVLSLVCAVALAISASFEAQDKDEEKARLEEWARWKGWR